jgi:hypothetical protein
MVQAAGWAVRTVCHLERDPLETVASAARICQTIPTFTWKPEPSPASISVRTDVAASRMRCEQCRMVGRFVGVSHNNL